MFPLFVTVPLIIFSSPAQTHFRPRHSLPLCCHANSNKPQKYRRCPCNCAPKFQSVCSKCAHTYQSCRTPRICHLVRMPPSKRALCVSSVYGCRHHVPHPKVAQSNRRMHLPKLSSCLDSGCQGPWETI